MPENKHFVSYFIFREHKEYFLFTYSPFKAEKFKKWKELGFIDYYHIPTKPDKKFINGFKVILTEYGKSIIELRKL